MAATTFAQSITWKPVKSAVTWNGDGSYSVTLSLSDGAGHVATVILNVSAAGVATRQDGTGIGNAPTTWLTAMTTIGAENDSLIATLAGAGKLNP